MGSKKYRDNHNRNPAFVVIRAGAKIGLMLAALVQAAAIQAGTDTDDWFEQDFETDSAAVNEGELEILTDTQDQTVHFHRQWLDITTDSLATGWVSMRQCHRNLDLVSDLQIVYRAGQTRELKVDSYERIGDARVSGHSVQLQDIEQGSQICISAQTRALHRTGDTVELRNGPFMRRFLDGYYPMRIRLEVSWPAGLLEPVSTQPVLAEYVRGGDTSLAVVDVRFSGRLNTVFLFRVPGGQGQPQRSED